MKDQVKDLLFDSSLEKKEANNGKDREHYSWRESSDFFSRTKIKNVTKSNRKKSNKKGKLIIVY